MAINNPYQSYKQNSVNTASPGELTLMLYNGCLKFINLAKKAIEENNIQERNKNIQKAEQIIQELMVTLNLDYEISKNLMSLYDYLYHRLVEANIQNSIEILNEVEEMVTQFRDTWKEAIKLDRQKKYGEGGNI